MKNDLWYRCKLRPHRSLVSTSEKSCLDTGSASKDDEQKALIAFQGGMFFSLKCESRKYNQQLDIWRDFVLADMKILAVL